MTAIKTFEQGQSEIAALAAHFARNRAAFCAPGVKEAHVRQDLIDPFFRALGWDVGNAARTAPQYAEVVIEDSLDIEGQQKAPDYAFRVGTLTKFYAEAKKCGVNIFADPAPAYQLRRYGWSAKAPLSVLTDFEEFAVYDCSARPRPGDKSTVSRVLYLRVDEYADRWRELWDIFSRESVWSGRFDHYAAARRKRGTSEVDVEFLREIEGWRDELARNIALRNHGLATDELNRAVQLTIDRLVFLRMAEDRGLEPFEQLLKLTERADIFPRFMRDLCARADAKYNSGLFHFQAEGGVSEAPDKITPRLTVDDKTIKPILQSLYFEHGSPYEFKVLPVEILGTIYERFLGKVIRLTAGHQAKVEEKPEVRKAGGVFYTPAYIVNYIVAQTVGRQIEGKSPAELAGARGAGGKTHGPDARVTRQPFRVLDMACGSGSFLLGAYQRLLDHCLKWYLATGPDQFPHAVINVAQPPSGVLQTSADKGPQPGAAVLHTNATTADLPPLPPGAYRGWGEGASKNPSPSTGEVSRRSREGGGAPPDWRLTIAEKKRILTTHIFGVDIDPQAVEVSKLSLLLKVLEGENEQSMGRQLELFGERALPNLSDNIKCGNSLIGPDYFTGRLIPDADEIARINAFDWHAEFPAVFGGTGVPPVKKHGQDARVTAPGGFDCVIGNPPYIRMETFKALKDYLRGNYACHEERSDLYAYFIERAHRVMTSGGRFGMIVSNKFLRAKYGRPLREFLTGNANVERVVDFAGLPVFEGATVRTIVLLTSRPQTGKRETLYSPPPPLPTFQIVASGSLSVESAIAESTYPVPPESMAQPAWGFGRPEADGLSARLQAACIPLAEYCDGQICMGVKSGLTEAFMIDADTRAAILRANPKADDIIKPFLNGRDVRRYQIQPKGDYLIYACHGVNIGDYPAVEEHLRSFKARLVKRATRQMWYELQQPQRNFADFMAGPKILFPDMAITPRFALDETGYFSANTTYFIPRRDLFLLGVLNSRFAYWYFAQVCAGLEGKTATYLRFFGQYLEGFPVPRLEAAGKTAEGRMTKLVEAMLALHKQLATAKSETQRTAIARQIEATDRQIDRLVYDLYGLSAAEIAIVEGTTG